MGGSSDWHDRLEHEVEERTARLNELNTELMEGIARLKKTEEALVRENQEWVRIFNATSNPIMILDDQHRILRANKAMADALGMTEQEVVGRSCFELVHGAKEPPHYCPHVHLLTDGREHSAEVVEPRLGGVYDVKVFPRVVEDGDILRSVHVARDITEEKRKERESQRQTEFLNDVLDSLTHSFYVIDPSDYTILIANRAAGLEDISVGRKCYAATHGRTSPCSGPDHPCPVIEVKKTGKPVRVEHLHFRREGQARHIEVHAYPIMNAEGEVQQIIEYALDITERRVAEEALRESEERFRSLFEQSSDGHLLMKENIFVEANDACLGILGLSSREEILSRSPDAFSPELQPDGLPSTEKVKAILQEAKAEGKKRFDWTIKKPDASPAVLDCQINLIRIRGEKIIHGVMRDITENLKALEALRKSEERFSLAIEGSRVGIVDWDVSSGKMFWSPRVFALLGYEPDEFEPTISLVMEKIVHPEDRDELLRGIRSHHEEHQPGEAECRFITKNGTVKWLRLSGQSSWDKEGRPLRTVGMIEDITERKQAEEAVLRSERKYRSLFDESRDGVYFVTRDGELTTVNPALCAIFDSRKEELIGKNVRELYVDPADRVLFQEEIERKGFVKDYEIRFRKKDGTPSDCLISASVEYGDDGSIVGYRGIMRDLTVRKRLQNQLYQAQKMEAIGTLAGGIAHDFNNTLQIVLACTDLLMMHEGRDSLDLRNLETIRNAAKEARQLVKGLLTFSRQTQSNKHSVDLSRQLKFTQRILRRMIPRMIEIELIIAEDLKSVNADLIQIGQVLTNLAINAHHAMPTGGKFTIEALNVTLDEDYCRSNVDAKPGEYVMLKISDTGIGMDKEVLSRIFEPFYTTKGPGVGTGLGLSIVYGIVMNHAGHITCSSEPGRGTTFNVYFPAGPGDPDSDAITMSGVMPAFGTEGILLVDDEGAIRRAVATMLTQSGYRVFGAENGNEALEIYQEKKDGIDLVILDLNMPGMGGMQCLAEIRKIEPNVKVLIGSGCAVDESTRKILEVEADGYIAKPFDAGDLLRAMRRILDRGGSPGGRVGGSRPIPEWITGVEGRSSAAVPPLFDEPSRAREAPDVEALPSRLRILAIDDREPYLRMLEAGLPQFGQTVLTASSGIEGLQVFQEAPVDVVLCDLGMPEIDGWAVAKGIKEICRQRGLPKTPFVLLTGQADMENVDSEDGGVMADCGVDAIVGKPVDIPDLLEVIGKLVKESRDRKN